MKWGRLGSEWGILGSEWVNLGAIGVIMVLPAGDEGGVRI